MMGEQIFPSSLTFEANGSSLRSDKSASRVDAVSIHSDERCRYGRDIEDREDGATVGLAAMAR